MRLFTASSRATSTPALIECELLTHIYAQQTDRFLSLRLRQQAGAQIRRPDDVRLLDDQLLARVESRHRNRKGEGKNQSEQAEQCCLQCSEVSSGGLRYMQPVADTEPEAKFSRNEDQDQCCDGKQQFTAGIDHLQIPAQYRTLWSGASGSASAPSRNGIPSDADRQIKDVRSAPE
jgi:hypothetical protein